MTDLANRFALDWDARVSIDPLFWMSESYADEGSMLRSGFRDLGLLFGDLKAKERKTALEIGCGVGRLLHAASSTFSRVVGVDVSDEALSRAKTLLTDRRNVSLQKVGGVDLGEIDGAFDYVYSYSVLAHIPSAVLARYLQDVPRVLTPGGELRAQMYVGAEVLASNDDTFSVRSYELQRVRAALHAASLDVVDISPLCLPFDAADHDLKRAPVRIVARKMTARHAAPVEEILSLLTAAVEAEHGQASEHEYRVVVTRVNELIEARRFEMADKFLEYALGRAPEGQDTGADSSRRRAELLRAQQLLRQIKWPPT